MWKANLQRNLGGYHEGCPAIGTVDTELSKQDDQHLWLLAGQDNVQTDVEANLDSTRLAGLL